MLASVNPALGKESIVLKSLPAVVVLIYFTASERKICIQKENKTYYVIENEKIKKTLTIIT